MYNAVLMDHFRNPRNYGTLRNANFCASVINESCGDSIILMGIVNNSVVVDVRYEGRGCIISQAVASYATTIFLNRTVKELVLFKESDLIDFLELTLGPNRLRCALLVFTALKKGLENVRSH